jgi:hypothetical protein
MKVVNKSKNGSTLLFRVVTLRIGRSEVYSQCLIGKKLCDLSRRWKYHNDPSAPALETDI